MNRLQSRNLAESQAYHYAVVDDTPGYVPPGFDTDDVATPENSTILVNLTPDEMMEEVYGEDFPR